MLAIAATSGWRIAVLGVAVVELLALGFLFANRRLLDDTQVGAVEPPTRTGGTFAFLGVGVVWMCFAFFLVAVMAFGGLQNFAPPIFERAYGVTLAFATTGLTAYLLGNAAGTATGGFFAPRARTRSPGRAALGSAAIAHRLATAPSPDGESSR